MLLHADRMDRSLQDLALNPEEPAVTSWRRTLLSQEWDKLCADIQPESGAPIVVAIDGRSASGKTTLAAKLAAQTPGAVVVSTDDIAWNEPLFGWIELMRGGVLDPFSHGLPVEYTPPAWVRHGRTGAIKIPAGTRRLILEGVGSADSTVSDLLDAVIWIQADSVESERRGIERDVETGENGNREEAQAFWDTWQAAERAHLAKDRPWERARLVVAGTPSPDLQPDEVLVADGPLLASTR